MSGFCRGVALAGVAAQLLLVACITQELPWQPPAGGPDEPWHRSVSLYIARHLAWPAWDAPELLRAYNCVSYATFSSAGYWVEGLVARWLGSERLSGVALLALLLLPSLLALRRRPEVSLVAVSFLSPQALLVFGYVNSDAWTVLVAFLLGIACARFYEAPDDPRRLLWLFVAAGACLSCRPHMWPIGALAGGWVLFPELPRLWRDQRRALLGSAVAGLIVASWWPVTGALANGDPVGLVATQRSVEQYCPPDPRQYNRPWGAFPVVDFLADTSRSLYGYWGWLALPLPGIVYLVGGLLVGLSGGWLWRRVPHQRSLVAGVFAANLILLVVYGMVWDYQPQGRYLFPAWFLGLGILVTQLAVEEGRWPAGRRGWLLAATLTALLLWNLGSAGWLLRRSAEIGDPRPERFRPRAAVPLEAAPAGRRSAVCALGWAAVPQQPIGELVEEAVALCREVGRPVATPAQTVELLGLPARGAAPGTQP